ncbi:MAG: hypothetical protein ACRDP9_10805 [Kribbellaceae bacterium]
MTAALEYAVPAGVDPRDHARVLARIRDAALSGARAPARPRPVIGGGRRGERCRADRQADAPG